jgi:hypothetical protein
MVYSDSTGLQDARCVCDMLVSAVRIQAKSAGLAGSTRSDFNQQLKMPHPWLKIAHAQGPCM